MIWTWILLMISTQAFAEKLVPLVYSTELCECKAMVDAEKNSPLEVKNALTISSLAAEANAKEKFQKLALPKDPKWEKIRDYYLAQMELKDYVKGSKDRFLAKNDPSELTKDFRGKKLNEKCVTIAHTLTDKKKLPALFKTLKEESCRTNIDPQRCLQNGLTENPKSYVLEMGWNNCVVNQWSVSNSDPDHLEKAQNEVKRHLIKEKCECGEP